VFFIWGGCCFACFAFAFFAIPETKGLSLEQVDLLYINSTPLTSVAYRNKLYAEDAHVQDTFGTSKETKEQDAASVEKA
jgi:MFS transporter, SP family, sugar:H+ symporter